MIRVPGPVLVLAACLALLSAIRCQAQHSDTSPAFAPAEAEARKFQLAPGLHLEVWAAEPQLENPVAFSLVPTPASPGIPRTNSPVTAYIAETHRYGVSVLDITQNTPWLLNDLSFRSVEDRSRFLIDQFRTNAATLTRDSEIVRRVADSRGSGRADSSEVFAAGFDSVADGTAAGVLAHDGHLWFANIPNLWRLSTGPSPTRTVLASGFGVHIGVTGHDLHGLTLGPDGRIYMSFGDRGLNVTNREGVVIEVPDSGGVLRCEPDGRDLELFCLGLRNPQELAFDDAGNLFTSDNDTAGADDCRVLHLVEGADYGWRASYQHMKGFGPWVREGLWRGDLDGQLPPAGSVSQGPAGLAFYPGTGFGNRFAGRFLHCDFPGGVWSFSLRPSGATFRVGEKQKILWNCWPTDVEFGPDNALYVLDWVAGWPMPKRGRIYRITPDSVAAGGSAVRPGIDAAVDLSGGIYEILRDGLKTRTDQQLFALLAHEDYRARLAAQFELARRGRPQLRALASLVADATDARIRRHALWAIGQILRAEPPDRSFAAGEELAAVDDAATDLDDDTRIQALRLLGDFSALNHRRAVEESLGSSVNGRVRFAARVAAAKMSSSKHRSALSASPQQRLLWRLANATGTTGAAQRAGVLQPITPSDPGFVGALEALGTVSGDDEPFERFGLALAMAPLAPGNIQQTLEQREAEAHLFLGARRAGLLALRRAAAPGIVSFLDDADPRLALEAARAIHDVPIPQAYPALAALLDSPTIHAWGRKHAFELQPPGALQQAPAVPTNAATLRPARDQVLFRALNAHFRLGQATNALALAQFAAQPTPPGFEAQDSTELRAEALFLLGAWEVLPAEPGRVPVFPTADPNHGAVPTVNPENWPGWFDRIVGVWRPLPPRSSDAARDALEPRIEAMISETNTALALAATDTAVRLKLARAGETLLARLKHPHTDGLLRRRVTSALAQLGSPRLAEALPIALADPDPELQAAALPYLNRLEGGQAVPLLAEKLRTATATTTPTPAHIRLGQAALAALGRIESPEAIPPLLEALDRLLAGPFPPALELDLLEAARRKSAEAITSRLARRDASLPAGDPLASWRETLFGGDATRGRAVFLERPEVQCSRCHKLGTEGGIVGPALDGIAKQRDRRYLLESIVQPNAQIAQGFDNVLVTLRDDREFAGTVRSETDDTLVLATVEAGEVKLPKTSIADRRRGLSAMPDGLAALVSRRDLRDLIEFLASLKN